ncbi:hypothetical protein ACVRWL_07230 [Streptococcus ratti]|uniref:Uncharacterized protein n=2 Tax=Streptococcus ratti TaxID=1341 RepID=A0A7X9QH64_STRRT|nr:hypothetical protein [Streptococcus ratti]EJN93606.1 hypothetical protein SRA_03691 [Streptococcus ratti FA-1 = DSM 20564]NMD49419.1 hypothetical protein [Streptococcus ratti]
MQKLTAVGISNTKLSPANIIPDAFQERWLRPPQLLSKKGPHTSIAV